MLLPIFTKLFEKLHLSDSKDNSPTLKAKNSTKGDHSPITNNLIVTNVYEQSFNEEKLSTNPPKKSKQTPLDIRHEIESRPPYQQKEASNQYKGLKVSWELKLVGVDEYGDLLRVSGSQTERLDVVIVASNVRADQYPRLKTMQHHDIFYVSGVIDSFIGSTTIELKDSTLTFVD